QSDGKVVVTGAAVVGQLLQSLVVRFGADGKPDPSFNTTGYATFGFGPGLRAQAQAIAVQKDGGLIVAGQTAPAIEGAGASDFALARLTMDGHLDPLFGSGGLVETGFGPGTADAANAVAIQKDGRIVAGGYTRDADNRAFALARYLPDGRMDSSFGRGGRGTTPFPGVQTEARSLAIQPDGRIVAAGTAISRDAKDVVLARYLKSGRLDRTFDKDGRVFTHFPSDADAEWNAVALQKDGKILVAGMEDAGP